MNTGVDPDLFCVQGVTLTDLQEAEKTMKTEQKEREKKKDDDERDGKQRKGEEGVRNGVCVRPDGLRREFSTKCTVDHFIYRS